LEPSLFYGMLVVNPREITPEAGRNAVSPLVEYLPLSEVRGELTSDLPVILDRVVDLSGTLPDAFRNKMKGKFAFEFHDHLRCQMRHTRDRL
jgi:hypothetical protein